MGVHDGCYGLAGRVSLPLGLECGRRQEEGEASRVQNLRGFFSLKKKKKHSLAFWGFFTSGAYFTFDSLGGLVVEHDWSHTKAWQARFILWRY